MPPSLKLNFQGYLRKTLVEFPWILVFELGILKAVSFTISRGESFSETYKGKVANLKIPEGFLEKYICPQLPCLDVFWNSPYGHTEMF